jgi:hypothetical protein
MGYLLETCHAVQQRVKSLHYTVTRISQPIRYNNRELLALHDMYISLSLTANLDKEDPIS